MTVELDVEAAFTVEGSGSAAHLEAHCGVVMAELVKLVDSDCGIFDPSVSLDLTDNSVLIEVSGEGETFEEAAERVDSCIRTAIHAAGGFTPEWSLAPKSKSAELVG